MDADETYVFEERLALLGAVGGKPPTDDDIEWAEADVARLQRERVQE